MHAQFVYKRADREISSFLLATAIFEQHVQWIHWKVAEKLQKQEEKEQQVCQTNCNTCFLAKAASLPGLTHSHFWAKFLNLPETMFAQKASPLRADVEIRLPTARLPSTNKAKPSALLQFCVPLTNLPKNANDFLRDRFMASEAKYCEKMKTVYGSQFSTEMQ